MNLENEGSDEEEEEEEEENCPSKEALADFSIKPAQERVRVPLRVNMRVEVRSVCFYKPKKLKLEHR